ncbi:hypothetical protein SEVIR_3G318300v4 [Setaria viridis]|uniref:Uncharacterized protein n=1 Tax=Setaria viridis TaxID=4556 RepID=A0A4U6VHX6_SETVI|nr:uncharacterized protein LOC117847664 [Setaria viridis]TKW28442.1 hypothetical protein SEVIR_3G318300v2 [Setaria viridis]
MEYKARRRHVPAFGEWNYYYSSSSSEEPQLQYSGAAAGDSGSWWYAAAEPEACSDAWFRYSPPPRSRPPAPKKPRRPAVAVPVDQNLPYCDGGNGGVPMTEVRARASVAGAAAVARAAPAKGGRRVVRPVDADLYRVPQPEDTTVSRRPRRKRASRSLWMGCLGGFNCVA